MAERTGNVKRKTKETNIEVSIDIDGKGTVDVETGVPFFNHMLELLAKHGMLDLVVQAKGDLEVDAHHTVEDVGICLGQAFRQALGEKTGIKRYGSSIMPMDEALSMVALDVSGRSHLIYDVKLPYDLDLDRTELGSKTGTAEAYSVLWLFAWGDASYAKAAENGDITILRSADQEIFQVLFGLYTRWRIVVYGD